MKLHLGLTSLLLGGLLVVLAGCAAPAAPALAIDGAWGRLSPTMPGAGGIFMLIKNTGSAADKLVSGKSDACGMVEVHEMVKNTDGTMVMNLVPNPVEIAAGGQLELKSGGMHIMCMKMKADQFKPGNTINLTLKFEKSGEKAVSVEIREK